MVHEAPNVSLRAFNYGGLVREGPDAFNWAFDLGAIRRLTQKKRRLENLLAELRSEPRTEQEVALDFEGLRTAARRHVVAGARALAEHYQVGQSPIVPPEATAWAFYLASLNDDGFAALLDEVLADLPRARPAAERLAAIADAEKQIALARQQIEAVELGAATWFETQAQYAAHGPQWAESVAAEWQVTANYFAEPCDAQGRSIADAPQPLRGRLARAWRALDLKAKGGSYAHAWPRPMAAPVAAAEPTKSDSELRRERIDAIMSEIADEDTAPESAYEDVAILVAAPSGVDIPGVTLMRPEDVLLPGEEKLR